MEENTTLDFEKILF